MDRVGYVCYCATILLCRQGWERPLFFCKKGIEKREVFLYNDYNLLHFNVVKGKTSVRRTL